MRSPPFDISRFTSPDSTPPSGNPYGPRRRNRRDGQHTTQNEAIGSDCAQTCENGTAVVHDVRVVVGTVVE
eukprot:3769846-Lingulodinium_polyedra.AAC.1